MERDGGVAAVEGVSDEGAEEVVVARAVEREAEALAEADVVIVVTPGGHVPVQRAGCRARARRARGPPGKSAPHTRHTAAPGATSRHPR